MMKIVEYKKHLVNGCLIDPEFIVSGNMFNDPINNTWVGKILDESERKYYVPDTLVQLTREQLIERVINLNLVKLSNQTDPHSEIINLTNDEIIMLIDTWINE